MAHGFYHPNFGSDFDPGSYNITAQQNQDQGGRFGGGPLQFSQNGPIRQLLRNFRQNRPRLFNRGLNEQGQPLGIFGNPYGPPVEQQQPGPQPDLGPYSSAAVANLPRTQGGQGVAPGAFSIHPGIEGREQPTIEGAAYSFINPRTGNRHNFVPNQQAAPQGYEFSNFDLGGGSVFRPQQRQAQRSPKAGASGPLSYFKGLDARRQARRSFGGRT